MKKLIYFLFASILTFSVLCSTVSADEGVNYAKNLKWSKGWCSSIKVSDGVTTATGFSQNYSTPFFNIQPALKDAMGDEDDVTVILSFKMHVILKKTASVDLITAKALIRGNNGKPEYTTASEWRAAYEESLDGEERFFGTTGSNVNILKYLDSSVLALTEDDWYSFETTITVSRAQLHNEFVNAWFVCFDNISSYNYVESFVIKDLAIYVYGEEPEDPEETPKPTEKAPEATKEASQPTATLRPIGAFPSPDLYSDTFITPAPVEQQDVSWIIYTCVGITAATIIVCTVTVIAVIKKYKR